ncbi:MAG TPA: hypothetical protein VLX61_11330 [Anaerolineales bacterium]|nr:hypothetical protein [Anaerolineales bacterium]
MKAKIRMPSIGLITILLFASLVTSACERTFTRNPNGSLGVQTNITQQQLQGVIQSSIADPLVKELNVQLQSGYILVTGQRRRLNDASVTDTMTFRLDLGVANGHLTATISNALIDNVPIEQARVNIWNQTIANRLANLGQRAPNVSLQSVSITPDSVTMNWQVSK